MNEPLDPTSARFTPRAPLPQVPATTTLWAPEIQSDQSLLARFAGHDSSPSLGAELFSANQGVSDLASGYSAGLPANLGSQTNLDSRSNLASMPSFGWRSHLGVPSLLSSSEAGFGLHTNRSVAGLRGNFSSNPTVPLAAKTSWNNSAFSPVPMFASQAAPPRAKDLTPPASTASPAIPKQTAQSSAPGVPGLLPNDIHNDTFVMDMDDGPDEIIADLKLQVESLITAIVMSSSQDGGIDASSALQGADGIEIAHRIMNRLKALHQENEYLGKLTSGARAAELEAKAQVLEKENAVLKREINDLQRRTKRAD